MNKEIIIFTGGGSGGHVVPALTLIEAFLKKNYEIHYIGSHEGIERELTRNHVKFYHPITTGKLRRYLDFENVKDFFRILKGFFESLRILLKIKKEKQVLVSMGGFVSVPVVIAAKLVGIKIVIHEQTTRVGLANKICSFFADKVFVSFKDSIKFFPKGKTYFSGYPIRDAFFKKEIGEIIFDSQNLKESKLPVIFITGGGNGSKILNDKIKDNLDHLCKEYLIIHQVGKFAIDEYRKFKNPNYIPLAFVGPEIIDLFKFAKIIISRSGAGTVCELMALGKRSIYVPLKIAQKNEQYFNALAAKNELDSIIISEDEFRSIDLVDMLRNFDSSKENKAQLTNGKDFLVDNILKLMI